MSDDPTPSAPADPMPPAPDDLAGDPAAGEAAEGGGGTGSRVVDGLLSTTPEDSVRDKSEEWGLPKWGAHAVVGGRKFLHGLAGSGVAHGTTAVEHFVLAPISYVLDSDRDQAEEAEPEEDLAGFGGEGLEEDSGGQNQVDPLADQ